LRDGGRIIVHRRVRSLRPIGTYGLRPGGRTPRKKFLDILCDLRVTCREILFGNGIRFHEAS
jgi:hypothetical protein